MARRVFFSFHYQNDIWRANQVRNSWITQDRETAGFWDAASWESVKRNGDQAIKNWINNQLSGTSVTVVLIGADTAQRRYVNYEIERSCQDRKGLLGVRIHGLQDLNRQVSYAGPNPFDNFTITDAYGRTVPLSSLYPTYDWVRDQGYGNFAGWIESAARAAGR